MSRNTVAVGIVVLDHLQGVCPITREEIFSETGGEVRGARSGLFAILQRHGIPELFLKEATTRQASHDAERLLEDLEYGGVLSGLSPAERGKELEKGIEVLRRRAFQWLNRQNLKISCSSNQSPSTWVHLILTHAEGKSGGRVEQHLVGAKLQKRHPRKRIPNHPGNAGDTQTGREGDFDIDSISYHVTATPGLSVLEKCKANSERNRHPILVVPRARVDKARNLAEEVGIDKELTILALEEFIAHNVIEISVERQTDFLSTMRDIVDEYNRRVAEVETDMSLKIEIQ
ncbi:MAG: DUF4928 family protein [Acidobacteria bacterium]|nr:DUF4928 family protein [Acidobacteriota bacterium]